MISTARRAVLFLAANPCGTDPRALDLEARSIRAEPTGPHGCGTPL
jgi:hypothetical protein